MKTHFWGIPRVMSQLSIPPAIARLCGDELCERVPQLRLAIGHAHRERAREHAHALRGMAANFGLVGLAAALAGLEAAARDNTDHMHPAWALVERELEPPLAYLAYC